MKTFNRLQRRLINLVAFLAILGTMGLMASLSGAALQTQVDLLQAGNRQVQSADSSF